MGPDKQDRTRREFEETALIHMNRIYNAALRLTRNKTDAEDLSQETFLRAYRFFHQFRQGSNCRAWLFAILHSLFINRVRQSSHLLVHFNEEEVYREGGVGTGLPANPEVDLFYRLAGEDVHRAIQELPPKLQVVVVLADLEGCSYREISEICSCPIGTVMSRLYRGRQALRVALKQYAKGGDAPQEKA
ncbi:MAG: sigma-70 family RNA polymerase sigma factor [Candidatus Methylomirabilales bacterium]